MHRLACRRPPRERDEQGAVLIMAAFAMTVVLVIGAMVLDFGLVRVDRQIDKSAADAATLAGLHGLDTGDGTPHPYMGVCTAIRYLKANGTRFSGISENTGWSDGLGTATADGCTNVPLRNKTCKPTDKSSWAKWSWTGTSQGVTLDVTIESGYTFPSSQWAEDSLPASSGDTGDPALQGCDQLAVTISQSREPGLGSLATDSDLRTAIRSVGRVKAVPGDSAPAMLLLKRTGCPVLVTGSNGGSSYVRVLGALATDGTGRTQPGTIHSDSDGVGCTGGNNGWVYGGLAPHGVVAYAAPVATNPSAADPSKPGAITSVAAANGLSAPIIRDSLDNVYGSSALNGTAGTKGEVTGRSLVTRGLVDERYFPGVKGAIGGTATHPGGAVGVFASGATGMPTTGSWVKFPTTVDACKPTQPQVDALSLTASSMLYVDCRTNAGFAGTGALSIPAGTVYFGGVVNPGATLKLPNAHHVYVGNHDGKADAITVGNNTSFEVNNAPGNLDPVTGTCSSGQLPSKAVLFVRSGAFKQTGGLLRMCRTTTIMMGGMTTSSATAGPGCVPVATGTAPTTTPCNGGLGSGQFSQNGGGIDWTAPNTLNATTDADGEPLPAALTAWGDVNGPEDLALWSESATTSSTNYSMAGGGLFQVRGVFMVPNADPFILSGGASLNLRNAQYVASSITLNGNTTNVTMSVDPNSAVTVPDQGLVGLVR